VSRFKLRNPAGSEYSFGTVEEFTHAIHSGGITADWEIYHGAGKRWLPITQHPVFIGRAPRKVRSGEELKEA
jgi:hypothetical protein